MNDDADAAHAEFGAPFKLPRQSRDAHHTPTGTVLPFVHCCCRRCSS